MPKPLRPDGSKAYLRSKWVLVPRGTYDPATPSLAILTGASALDVTYMLYASSSKPSQTTNMARSPKRVGDGQTYEFVGESQASLGEVRYSYNQQAAAGSDQLKAYEKLVPGTQLWLVNRRGIDRDTDLALAQFVTSYPIECGVQTEVEEGDAEGAEDAIVQALAITGPIVNKKAIVA